ncbi:MAG: MarR family transcriptional regulator [Reyranella sp.]|uniref:MarR family winged helix-turn-helix transcriptional regulator n=1 Tax=Reyranella sp. TaxID=1929291 RepID=UPI00272EF58B|nr:MarR family transcriptional regulator [Reyranella sp.]MDP1962896.1 MarR family transcriptional regulator [Reyranella sp.]MDP2378174.1 MarR family transcriptional regulator [Reyranella sp.]
MRHTKRTTGNTPKRPALQFDPNSLLWIGLRLTVLSTRYMSPVNALLEHDRGLSRDDVTVTVCLSITNATSAQEIVRYTGRPKNSVSRSVTSLEERGFLRRYSDARDRRSSKLSLTARGQRLFDLIAACFVERDGLLLDPLSQQERRDFNRLLNKIATSSAKWPER